MKLFFAFVLPFAVLLGSCGLGNERIRGNGNLKNETRSTGSFSSVDVSGNIKVFVKQDSTNTVSIATDENLLEFISITTEGDELIIKPKDHKNLSGSNDIKVYVTGPVFKKFQASGASEIHSENLLTSALIEVDISGASKANLEVNAPKISAALSGASSIKMKGHTKDFRVDADGASQAKCFELLAENVEADADGASSAEVFASVKLIADASGASHIKYKGVSVHTGSASGAGSISKAQ